MTEPTQAAPVVKVARCDWSDLPAVMCGCGRAHATESGTGAPSGVEVDPNPTDVIPGPQIAPRVIWSPSDEKRLPTPRDWHDGDKPPKKASRCRWVEEWGYYLPEHEPTCRDRECAGCLPCTHDEHGDPTLHCTARDRCAEHLDDGHPLTCPRCVARVRANLAHIERLYALMDDQAQADGIESTAAYLAGPVANPELVSGIRTYVRGHAQHWLMAGRMSDAQVMKILTDLPEDDERHPLSLLWRWERMLAEDYGHERTGPVTVTSAASYLSWLLTDMAQDDTQDFPLFAREVASCKSYLENVLGASRAPERGAPCWRCADPKPRLVRRRAHWCDRDDCTREHDATGARDTWTCPTNGAHWWTEADYRRSTYEDAVTADPETARASGFKRPRGA